MKKRSVYLALFLLFFFSNSYIFSVFFGTIETNAVKYEDLKDNYEYGIVLGGFSSYDDEFNRLNFNKASDRLWQTLFLYKNKKIKKIIISGGSGKLFKNKYKEANFVNAYLISLGINQNDIILENKSRNTYENAIYTRKILGLGKNKNCLLITSSIHALRAEKCFRKAGFNIDVFPTNYISDKNRNISDYIIPNSRTLFLWDEFMHEIGGLAIYKITGKI